MLEIYWTLLDDESTRQETCNFTLRQINIDRNTVRHEKEGVRTTNNNGPIVNDKAQARSRYTEGSIFCTGIVLISFRVVSFFGVL